MLADVAQGATPAILPKDSRPLPKNRRFDGFNPIPRKEL